MYGRRGFYEIIMVFFLIIVLIVSVLFILQAAAGSATIYAAIKKTSSGPRDAMVVKDTLLACHRIDYLDAELFDMPCPGAQGHYAIRQMAFNGCEGRSWNSTAETTSQIIPFVVTIEQENSTRKCLGTLEIYLGAHT